MARNPDGSDATGFSGLDSMLSDVEETIAAVPEAKAPEPQKSKPHFVAQGRTEGATSSTPAPSGGFTTAGKWFVGVVVVGILVAVFGGSGKPKDTPVIYSPSPAPAPAPGPSKWEDIPSKPAPAPRAPVAPSIPPTEVPPVGTDMVLSAAQMRYCFTEDIRSSAIRPELNGYSSKDVADFNAMVSDYNSRCGSFKYRKGTMEGTRAEVESRRAAIESEAKRQWARGHAGTKEVPAKPKAVPKKPAIPAHAHLDYLGHDWECNHGYHVSGSECVKLTLPANSHVDYLGHDWECNRGYHPYGNGCVKLALPANSHVDYLGHDWECNRGYRPSGNECVKLAVPAHAHIDYLGHDWECNRGYSQVGNQCEPVGKR